MRLSVSVIVATHDRAESLRRAVDSVLTQSCLPLELIVVNDGDEQTPPDIAGRADAAGVTYRSLRQGRASLPAARNRAMEISRGDVILFIDDDVVLPAEYLLRLIELYELDAAGVVAGIGGRIVEPDQDRLPRRIWEALAVALGLGRFSPRRCAGRYVALPVRLRGRLVPARRLSGGAMSLRDRLAKSERFDERFGGYALGEDREFSFRVGRRWPLFSAPDLEALHLPAARGRPDFRARGRMYAGNSMHIARYSVEDGAGTRLLLAYDLAGTMILYLSFAALRWRRTHLDFAAGVAWETLLKIRDKLRNYLCGS
ncbi:MAG: glycosyltransferase [Planctomycetota bacterium]|nr:glycosyltransferase [Planctomycetota bacterium]